MLRKPVIGCNSGYTACTGAMIKARGFSIYDHGGRMLIATDGGGRFESGTGERQSMSLGWRYWLGSKVYASLFIFLGLAVIGTNAAWGCNQNTRPTCGACEFSWCNAADSAWECRPA